MFRVDILTQTCGLHLLFYKNRRLRTKFLIFFFTFIMYTLIFFSKKRVSGHCKWMMGWQIQTEDTRQKLAVLCKGFIKAKASGIRKMKWGRDTAMTQQKQHNGDKLAGNKENHGVYALRRIMAKWKQVW